MFRRLHKDGRGVVAHSTIHDQIAVFTATCVIHCTNTTDGTRKKCADYDRKYDIL